MVSILVIGIMGPHTCMPCMRTHAFLSGPYPQARQRALQAQAGWLDNEPPDEPSQMDIIEAQLLRPCHNHKAIFTRPVTRQILAGVFGPGFLSMDAQAPLCTIKEVYSTPLLYPGGPWGGDTHGYN